MLLWLTDVHSLYSLASIWSTPDEPSLAPLSVVTVHITLCLLLLQVFSNVPRLTLACICSLQFSWLHYFPVT